MGLGPLPATPVHSARECSATAGTKIICQMSDPLASRVVDTSASTGSAKPLAAPRNASLGTDVNNLSARASHKIQQIQRKAVGLTGSLFGARRGKRAEAARNSEDADDDAAGAMIAAANREYEPQLFSVNSHASNHRHLAAASSC